MSVDAAILRNAMEEAFGGSDAEGLWTWKLAYEATEAAQVLFLRKYGRAMRDKAASPEAMLAMLSRLASLLPTQTRRSEESQALQQFSTPLPLAWVASIAAGIKPDDTVLEPSAGTGMLAIFAEISDAHLALNEIAETRAALLHRLFPEAVMSRHDAASIDDRLEGDIIPSIILMNPPFSAAVNVNGRAHEGDFHHVCSALARLPQGGRLVAITGHNFPVEKLSGAVRFTCTIDGSVYSKHGTSFETRLTVVDKSPESITPPDLPQAEHVADLLAHITEHVPPRMDVCGKIGLGAAKPVRAPKAAPAGRKAGAGTISPAPEAIELAYEPVEWKPAEGADLSDAIYEGYTVQSIHIPGAAPHPTKLVQSAAMASVAPPHPSYRPHVPPHIIHDGILSGAQLESVIYAGEAHSGHLAGAWIVDETGDNLHAAPDGAEDAVRFRRGWFLGDGTGCGKGRQVAGVILDNWIKGRRKSLWISKSDKLIEDARRDWSALGGEPLLIQPLSRFKSGAPVRLLEGILFCTYATLRNEPRLKQIVDWLGHAPDSETGSAFDGVIVFDEAHAMANAAGGKSERGEQLASQQGRAGLRLQRALPDARIVYVSATGATDVRNLAYAERLGLWGGADFPFANRAEFIEAVEAGGVAAMEILARDMKSLGLYTARSLSYDGVEIEIVEHALTAAQIEIYDAYAQGFQVIHQNLKAALKAAGITGESRTLNGQAKSAALSVFESSKQRFFAAMLTGMKVATLIKSIERDLAAGHAAIVQIVSTGEAILDRRLSEIPAAEWADLNVDLSPRDIVLTYLQHAFPTQLYEPYTDEDGNLRSRPLTMKRAIRLSAGTPSRPATG